MHIVGGGTGNAMASVASQIFFRVHTDFCIFYFSCVTGGGDDFGIVGWGVDL